MPREHIVDDVKCKCGYNLRGLAVDRNCPECGTPVLRYIRFTQRRPAIEENLRVRDGQRGALKAAIAESPYPPEAFSLVLDVMEYTACLAERTGVHISGQLFCAHFCRYVSKKFSSETKAIYYLASLGIDGSEDLGKIVFRLVETGRLRASREDRTDDFANQFTLANVYRAAT